MIEQTARHRPRLGFLGVGWIGRMRLESVVRQGLADVIAIADPSEAARNHCAQLVPTAQACMGFNDLMKFSLDGIVIATPSALHSDQTERALAHGLAVFCQKPLGRNAVEVARVIAAARHNDKLLGVDFSYRHLRATQLVREMVSQNRLGDIYAVQLTFHNAYGPDKSWFYDPRKSGGGCLIDLGIHLLDLAAWILNRTDYQVRSAQMFASGSPCTDRAITEDFVTTELCLGGKIAVRMACSWGLSAGRDAVIAIDLFGTEGAAQIYNVDGSFFDFGASHNQNTHTRILTSPPDNWSGRAITDWVSRLQQNPTFDASCETLLAPSKTVDQIYEFGATHRTKQVIDAYTA